MCNASIVSSHLVCYNQHCWGTESRPVYFVENIPADVKEAIDILLVETDFYNLHDRTSLGLCSKQIQILCNEQVTGSSNTSPN